MANPRFAWGIDVGNRALKAVKLVRDGGGGMRVDDVDVIEHEHILSDAGDNKEALVAHSLQTFSQKHPEKGGAVAIGASGQSSFARFIKLPPVEEKKIPEIVRFEAIQQIPFPLDDVEWSYQLFRNEGSPDVEVGIFAMRKELVNSHIKQFTDAGLNVQVVQMSPLAVYNAMYYDQRVKGTTMIVDVGAENTDLIIAEGEQVWLRSIPVGGNNFTEALVKQFKLKFPKAEDLKRNAATSKYTRQILQAMRPVFDSLVAEIQRSIGFYASVHRDARISRVVALGGTFRLPGLMKFLQMQLQLDVQRFDALGAAPPTDARVATLLNDNVLSTVGAYGLALQAMGEGKITSSLLPLAIRRERMWREKTKWFAAAAALICVGTGVAVGRVYYDRMQYASSEQARTDIDKQLEEANRLSTAWQEVEASGKPERDQIASLQSLTHLRDIQAKLLMTIDKVLPEPTPKPKDKRAERRVLQIDDLFEGYYEDLGPAVVKTAGSDLFTMTKPEFIQNASTSAQQQNYGYGAARGVRVLAGNRFGPGAVAVPTGVSGDPNAVPVDAPAAKQRGYLITLVCTTPKTRWSDLAEQVRDALVEQTKPDPNSKEKQAFRIERVEIVSGCKLLQTEMVPAARARPNVGQAVSRRPIAGHPGRVRPGGGVFRGAGDEMEGGGAFYRGRRPPGLIPPPRGPGGARSPAQPGGTYRRPGATEDPATAEEQIEYPMPAVNFDQPNETYAVDPNAPVQYLDPLTGEDATTDVRLTFLVAVVLDPAPPAPPAPPAAPADGEQAPPAPAESAAAN